MNNKKIHIIVMSIILSFSMFINAFAKFDEDLFTHLYRHIDKEGVNLSDNVIEYFEIEDYIFHNNPTMRKIWLVFDANKNVQDTADMYYDAADSLEGSTGDEATDAMNAAKAHGLRISGDNATDDSYVNYLNNIITEKNLVLNTKIAFINYYKSMLSLIKAQKDIEEKSRLLESGKLNYDLGLLTKTELLKLQNDYKEAEANIILIQSDVTTYKRTVLINCGYSMFDEIQLGNITHVTSAIVDSHNDFNDKNQAIENSIQYLIYLRKYENSRSEESKVTNKINVDNAKSFIVNDIDQKYQNMHDALTNIYTHALAFEYASDLEANASNSFIQGSISKKEYSTILYNKEVARIEGELKFFDLDIAYEQYIASIDGLANAGNG